MSHPHKRRNRGQGQGIQSDSIQPLSYLKKDPALSSPGQDAAMCIPFSVEKIILQDEQAQVPMPAHPLSSPPPGTWCFWAVPQACQPGAIRDGSYGLLWASQALFNKTSGHWHTPATCPWRRDHFTVVCMLLCQLSVSAAWRADVLGIAAFPGVYQCQGQLCPSCLPGHMSPNSPKTSPPLPLETSV